MWYFNELEALLIITGFQLTNFRQVGPQVLAPPKPKNHCCPYSSLFNFLLQVVANQPQKLAMN